MKKSVFFAILFCLFAVSDALAQCNCSGGIVGVAPHIYKTNAPLRKGGRPYPAPLVGYRTEVTLIDNRGVLNRGRIALCAINNQQITTCPWASAIGHKGRARCTIQTASLRRAALRLAGNPAVRFQLKGNKCLQVPDAGRCYGSVKGLCNRTIK